MIDYGRLSLRARSLSRAQCLLPHFFRHVEGGCENWVGSGGNGSMIGFWVIVYLLRILFHAIVQEILNPTLPPRLLTLQTSIDTWKAD